MFPTVATDLMDTNAAVVTTVLGGTVEETLIAKKPKMNRQIYNYWVIFLQGHLLVLDLLDRKRPLYLDERHAKNIIRWPVGFEDLGEYKKTAEHLLI